MALRVAGHHRAIEDIQHGEEVPARPFIRRRPCVNLAFLVNGQNNGVRRRIDAEPDKRRAPWGRDVPLRNPNVAV
jgi:hypothetical protein